MCDSLTASYSGSREQIVSTINVIDDETYQTRGDPDYGNRAALLQPEEFIDDKGPSTPSSGNSEIRMSRHSRVAVRRTLSGIPVDLYSGFPLSRSH